MEEVKEKHKPRPSPWLSVKRNFIAIHLYLFLAVAGTTVYLLLSVNVQNRIAPVCYEPRHRYYQPGQNYTIQTEGCYIPAMEPFSEAVRRFYIPKDSAEHDKWKCTNMPPLLKRNRTHVWVSKETFSDYNITDNNDFSCCSQAYYRPDRVKNVWAYDVDDRVEYGTCVNFTDSIQVLHEFLNVTCYVKEEPVYTNAYLFAQRKNTISSEITNASSYNVMVLGINSVSRLSFHRTMPKTLSFLYDKGAVELLGYTAVGPDAYINMVAMLIGKQADTELKDICLPYRHATFDSCSFVWRLYKQSGYYTAFAEDINGTFNNKADGFFRKPTEYYTHTYTVGIPSNCRGHNCVKERYFHEIILDYLEDLLWTLKRFNLFGVFWSSSLSQNDLNAPTLMDAGYFNFLKRLDSSDFLKSTIIILVSDHGFRFGDIRTTEQGHSENRLPFAFLLMPPTFKKNYSAAFENLILNSDRLTSPFDMHETIKDLSELSNLADQNIKERSQRVYGQWRGISLFLPIPGDRTCELAGIPEEWCMCRQLDEVWRKAENVTEAAAALMVALNGAVRAEPQCAPLALERVEQAVERMEAWQRELRLVLRTRPGGGLFEGTLRAHGDHWQLVGSLDRINPYGNQSGCVRDRNLIPYCYCKITEPEASTQKGWRKAENVTQAAAVLMAALNEAVRAEPQCAALALERVEQAFERMEAWQRELRLVLRTRPGGGLFEGTLRAHGDHWQLIGSLDRINPYGNQSGCVRDRNLIPYCYCKITEPEASTQKGWRKAENVTQAAAVLMAALNEAVRAEPQCAALALERVEQAFERVGAWQRELRLMLLTRPGGGLFEGTLRAHGDHWQLVGSLDRINRYGNQSDCVRDRNLMPYCYCNITEPEASTQKALY